MANWMMDNNREGFEIVNYDVSEKQIEYFFVDFFTDLLSSFLLCDTIGIALCIEWREESCTDWTA